MTDAEKALLEAVLSENVYADLSKAKLAVRKERLGPLEAEIRSLCREQVRINVALSPYYRMFGGLVETIYEEEHEKVKGEPR